MNISPPKYTENQVDTELVIDNTELVIDDTELVIDDNLILEYPSISPPPYPIQISNGVEIDYQLVNLVGNYSYILPVCYTIDLLIIISYLFIYNGNNVLITLLIFPFSGLYGSKRFVLLTSIIYLIYILFVNIISIYIK